LLVIFKSSDNFLLHMQKVHIKDRNVEYLEGKINELEINGKNKNIIDLYRGIKKFNFGYHT